MKFWATYCKVLGYIWLVVTGILILVGIAEKIGTATVKNIMPIFDEITPPAKQIVRQVII